MVEYGILVFDEGNTKHVKDAVWAGQRLATDLVLN
jgi:hypothetical protein